MERTERVGLGVATAGHVALLALLSLSIVARPKPLPKLAEPIDVQLVDAIGARSAAPVVAKEAPAPSKAPDVAPPEDAAPAPDAEAPPPPEPRPAPPPPKPAPPKPAPPKPEPKPEPAPPKPAPKPAPKAPAPKPVAEKPAKPAPAKPAPAKPEPAKAAPAKAAPAKPAAAPAATPPPAKPGAGKAAKRGGGIESDDFLKGITPEKAPGKAQAPHAQAISALAMNGLAAAIKRQIQPCYELGSLGGTSAMSIVTTLNLRFNKDGSVAGTPTLVGQSGIDDGNQSYAKQVADIGRRAVLRCAPLKLPPELYEGGWDNLNFRFTPGQMQ